MIYWIIWTTGCCLVLWLAIQFCFVLAFAARLKRWQPLEALDQDCPHVAVLLSLRGNDPFLADTIRGLLQQDYPSYSLRFVVDHSEDPAAQIAAEALVGNDSTNASIRLLEKRSSNCSLLCSSIVQAVEDLEDGTEVVAFVDADVCPDPRWLRDLVLPLLQPNVSMTMGNRWFVPAADGLGSSVRYIFNAVAVLHMYWCGLIWGGSMAIRTNVLKRSGLIDRWKRALFHDSPVYSAIRECGFHPVFVPGVMMVNRESCALVSFFGWMKRQLLNTWLYHPNWKHVAVNLVFGITLLVAALVGSCVFFVTGFRSACGWYCLMVAAYWVAFGLMIGIVEVAVRSATRRRDQSPNWLSMASICKVFLLLPIAACMSGFALLLVPFTRRVQWRGVSYNVFSAWNVELVDYQTISVKAAGSVASL